MMVHTSTRQQLLVITTLFLVAVAFSAEKAKADILLAGFEGNLNSPYLDEFDAPIAWEIIEGTSAYSTATGVTEGTSSMERTSPADWLETFRIGTSQIITDLAAGTELALDVNVPLGTDTDTDWISFQFYVNSPTLGWLASPSLYDANSTGDGDVTITWDYSELVLDETDAWFELGLIINPGEDRTLYMDNLRVLTAGSPGDFDSDSDVDGADFLEWQRSDGTVGGLSDWQGAYPAAASASFGAVPEPATFGLLSLAMLLISAQRRRNLA